MYIIVLGDKGSYDRPINLSVMKEKYNTLEEASEGLKKLCPIGSEEAIKNQKTEYKDKYGSTYWFGYTDGLVTYFSSGCPADNEYDGETIQVFRV